MLTHRLEIRDAIESDRARFVELFGDEEFMAFSGGVLDVVAAGGTVHALIDPTNEPSKAVARKLGFEFWKLAVVNGFEDEIHRRRFP